MNGRVFYDEIIKQRQPSETTVDFARRCLTNRPILYRWKKGAPITARKALQICRSLDLPQEEVERIFRKAGGRPSEIIDRGPFARGSDEKGWHRTNQSTSGVCTDALLREVRVLPGSSIGNNFTSVPLHESRVSAGGGAWIECESIRAHYAFRSEWLRKVATSRRSLKLVFVSGDSMEPRLCDGDIVMIDTGRTNISSGQVYAIREDGLVSIKRLQALPDGYIAIVSDNPKYPVRVLGGKDVTVLGKIVWSGHEWK